MRIIYLIIILAFVSLQSVEGHSSTSTPLYQYHAMGDGARASVTVMLHFYIPPSVIVREGESSHVIYVRDIGMIQTVRITDMSGASQTFHYTDDRYIDETTLQQMAGRHDSEIQWSRIFL